MIFENIQRIDQNLIANPLDGTVVWSPTKSLFLIAMYAMTVIGIVHYLRIDTVLLFLGKTIIVLMLGHSVGMHRRLIHKSFQCPLWLEHIMVYLGVLVGLGGPFTMIRTHDTRDWAQRSTGCHDFFAHRQAPWLDALWQMHCACQLRHPPKINIEPEVYNDIFYRFIEKHWVTAHLPWVIVFYAVGGWAYVIWGVCAQVSATVTGHWIIGYLAHSDEKSDWDVTTSNVQGQNVPYAGLITMGEAWHNNHHAFPSSARLGLYKGQADPGFWFIKCLEGLGLASHIQGPEDLAHRPQLQWLPDRVLPVIDHKTCHLTGLKSIIPYRP